MPKKKVDKPLFLEFVNFPLVDKITLPLARIKSRLERFLEESNISHHFISTLKATTLENFDNEYMKSIISLWLELNRFILTIIDIQILSVLGSKGISKLSTIDKNSSITPNLAVNIRHRGDAGGFEIELVPDSSPLAVMKKDDFRHFLENREWYDIMYNDFLTFTSKYHKPGLFLYIGADFIKFFQKYYKPYIFSHCKYSGCERIIITTNGRKYCCRYHGQKASIETKKKNSDYEEYRRILHNVGKRFNRYPFKTNREDFIKKDFREKGKIDLYHRFRKLPK